MKSTLTLIFLSALLFVSCLKKPEPKTVFTVKSVHYADVHSAAYITTDDGPELMYPEEWVRNMNLKKGDSFQKPSDSFETPAYFYAEVSKSEKIPVIGLDTTVQVFRITLVPEKKYQQYFYNETIYSSKDYSIGKEFMVTPTYGDMGEVTGFALRNQTE
jgi:hypothetical protein